MLRSYTMLAEGAVAEVFEWCLVLGWLCGCAVLALYAYDRL